MPARRLPIGLIAPVALVVLITALGFLQYRWVGQVSERERDQLRQSLERRAREFAVEFDREIGRAYELFAPEAGFQPDSPERFAKQHDEWQTASSFAGLLKTAYYAQAQADGDDFLLFRYTPATRTFEAIEWPAALMPARSRLKLAHTRTPAQIPGGANVIALTGTPVLPSIPAILIPEHASPMMRKTSAPPTTATERAMLEMMVKVQAGRSHVVLELDREFLAGQLLPTLTSRHFPETGSDSVRVAVVSGRADEVFSRGLRAGHALDLKTADASATFFGLRMEMVRTATVGAPVAAWAAVGERTRTVAPGQAPAIRVTPSPVPAPDGARPGAIARSSPQQFSMVIEQSASAFSATDVRVQSGWTLLLQHSAGSLDAAVAQVRRRNLFMSFGILGVLAASAGLVMVNARRSEKLAAQQMDFVATVSHELRTPLAVIRSAAQNLSAGVVHDASQAKRYGNLIEAEGRRLTDMVEQVLEYAGLSDARRRPASKATDAGAIARDVVAATASIDDTTDVTFDVRIDPELPPILADEDAIRRALHNLIGNAIKYGRNERWVGLNVSRGRGADEKFVLISVADRGRGIPADELAHIFEPFYRGRHAIDQQIRGNGLGLSLVKRIVEAHGGRVTVQSSPDQGSTFTLHVPVATGAAAETVAHVDVDASPGLNSAAADRGGHPV